MPVTITCEESESIEVDDLIEYLEGAKINYMDAEEMASAAPMLKKLSNNRMFLASKIAKDMKNYRSMQTGNSYNAQVHLLHKSTSKKSPFVVRACLWISDREYLLKASGMNPFSYFLPHDHNFNFLTIGYFGPGYWSDYYEYDYNGVTGYLGEEVSLKAIGRSRLDLGKMLLYRASLDVHNQLPADSFSVSINVMEAGLRARNFDQYRFDLEQSAISGLVNDTSAKPLFDILACCGSDEDRELLKTIVHKSPSERTRFVALQALSSCQKTPQDAISVLKNTKGSSKFIREWAKRRILTVEETLNAPNVKAMSL